MSLKQFQQFWRHYRSWIVLAIIGIAAIYSLLRHFTQPAGQTLTASPSPSATTAAPISSQGPVASPSVASQVSPSPSSSIPADQAIDQSAIVDTSSDIIYYHDFTSAEFKKRSITTGQETVLAPGSVFIDNVYWAPSHAKVLLALTNGQGNAVQNPFYLPSQPFGAKTIGLYEFSSQKFTPLNQNITAARFLTDDLIIYQYKDQHYNNLSISKPDGSGWRNIATLSGMLRFASAGGTVLSQLENSTSVSRYDASGKVAEQFNVPSDLSLNQSTWASSGHNAIYWTVDQNTVTIKRLSGSDTQTLTTLPKTADDFTILWDNKIGALYYDGFGGLKKLDVSSSL